MMEVSSHGRISPEFPLGFSLERLRELRVAVTASHGAFGKLSELRSRTGVRNQAIFLKVL